MSIQGKTEKEYLKELADRYQELAELPVMEERAKLWRKHNDGDKSCTPVIIEIDSFYKDLLPELLCEDPFNRELEEMMQLEIVRAKLVGDDRVIPKSLEIPLRINHKQFDHVAKQKFASEFGFHVEPCILDISTDLQKLKHSIYSFDAPRNNERLARANEIMPSVFSDNSLRWLMMYTKYAVDFMGMQDYLFAIMDYPEKVHELMAFLREDIEGYIKWHEKEGLLTANNGNHYVGSGSYGFTDELSDKPLLKNMWGNMNSQESVGISPDTFGEFVYPYYAKTAELFGKVYWGCCEAVDQIWDKYISHMPNLAKVSISAWCDEEFMGERLANSKIIYSRKPSPNFIGVPEIFDEVAFGEHIKKTLCCARDCNIEFIMRDIYTLKGDKNRAKKAVDITRGLIANR